MHIGSSTVWKVRWPPRQLPNPWPRPQCWLPQRSSHASAWFTSVRRASLPAPAGCCSLIPCCTPCLPQIRRDAPRREQLTPLGLRGGDEASAGGFCWAGHSTRATPRFVNAGPQLKACCLCPGCMPASRRVVVRTWMVVAARSSCRFRRRASRSCRARSRMSVRLSAVAREAPPCRIRDFPGFSKNMPGFVWFLERWPAGSAPC
jgi:hypothetical protein